MQGIVDSKKLARFRKALLEEKQRLLNNSRNTLQNDLAVSTDDLSDESDLATSEINQSLIFTMRDRDRKMLTQIDEALHRMDGGVFGMCDSCEEPIEPRRLEAKPTSTFCVACQERQEHKQKVYA